MRTDQYLITINKRGVKVEQDWNSPLSKPIPMADYDALIVALQRWRDDHQKQVDYWGVEEPTIPPEWHDPAPVADPVTYTVYWEGLTTKDIEAEGITRSEATEMVCDKNSVWLPFVNHWAVGTDGSIIGRVGAPE